MSNSGAEPFSDYLFSYHEADRETGRSTKSQEQDNGWKVVHSSKLINCETANISEIDNDRLTFIWTH